MTDKAKREIVYWDCNDDADSLEHENIDDAIKNFLDGFYPGPMLATIEVYGWARQVVTPKDLGSPLDLMFDRLSKDEESRWFGDGVNGDFVTPAMRTAEAEFLAVVAREFAPWSCEIVETRVINVAEWVAANRPEWIGEGT